MSTPAAAKQHRGRHYSIRVDGIARSKARPRVANGRAYTPESTKQWEERVGWEFISVHGRPRIGGPVKVHIFFHQSLADIDNLCKAVLDALNGIAYEDDRQVVELNAKKEWRAKREHWVDITVEAVWPS